MRRDVTETAGTKLTHVIITEHREEMHPQIRCIATVIRDIGGEAIAAISLSGLSQNKSFRQMKNLANEMKEAGEEISRNLGYEQK